MVFTTLAGVSSGNSILVAASLLMIADEPFVYSYIFIYFSLYVETIELDATVTGGN